MARREAYTKSSFITHRYKCDVYREKFTGTVETYDAAVPNGYITAYSSVDADRNPRWREAIKQGLCATTYLSGSQQRVYRLGGVMDHEWDKKSTPGAYRHFKYSGDFVTPQMANDPNLWPDWRDYSFTTALTEADNCAKMRFLRRAKERASSEFQGGVFTGELRETIKLLKSPLAGFRKVLLTFIDGAKRHYHRLNRRNAQARANALAEQWLEWSFGIKPLVSDLQSLSQVLLDLGDERRSSRVKASCLSSKYRVLWPNNRMVLGNFFFDYDIQQEGYAIVTYLGVLKDEMVCGKNKLSLANFGLTLDEFVPTLYQLAPWSFLVDYFVNLDDIVEAVSFRRSNIAWVQKTTHKIHERELVNCKPLETSGWVLKSWRPSEWKTTHRRVLRDEYLGSFVPTVTWKAPVSPIKGANMLALAMTNASTLERIGASVLGVSKAVWKGVTRPF